MMKKSNTKPPEAAGAWPVVGHLRLLGGPDLPHKTLGAMADKYGPIFVIRIGSDPTVVVSSSEAAREIFTINDKIWASKPTVIAAMKHMGYDAAMYGFHPMDHIFLLSNRRLESIKHVWISETNTSIKQLYEKVASDGGETLVDMKKWFSVFTMGMSLRLISGKRCFVGDEDEVSRRYQKALSNFFRLVAVFVPSDAIPILRRWIDLRGYESKMKKTGQDLDSILGEMLDEHKIKKQKRSGEEAVEEDFMDVMLSVLEKDPKVMSDCKFDADTIIKATCKSMMVACSDTLMVTLVWVLSLLVNHPHILQKVHEEMDTHVGRERQVHESDIKNLLYLQAATKETLRLYPPGPIMTRESTEDCTLLGYHIPAATRLMVNISKVQRDPKVWTSQSEFKPERFLAGGEVDVSRYHSFQFMPFGGGRRSFPGTSLALQVVHLALARLIHGFDFKTPSGEPTDMTESPGLTNVKATPLDLLVTPRLSSKLYTC
ncbi:hypothetical protein MKW98_022382 [Papaver atlanticum]|uniref:Cytochrome P450 n=1 Tax=Papaver atlanticum TaxID=357466 RepID=A0AAD4XJ68_9MAGN|nr:hypothetical protein MKW98_022382 [Papaver atlanticum]